jgi:hypothetical protein
MPITTAAHIKKAAISMNLLLRSAPFSEIERGAVRLMG